RWVDRDFDSEDLVHPLLQRLDVARRVLSLLADLDHFSGELPAGKTVDGDRDLLAEPDASQRGLRHPDPHPELRGFQDSRDRLVRADEIPRAKVERVDDAVRRCLDDGLLALAPEAPESLPLPGECGLGRMTVPGPA